jgi:hypothetical protein
LIRKLDLFDRVENVGVVAMFHTEKGHLRLAIGSKAVRRCPAIKNLQIYGRIGVVWADGPTIDCRVGPWSTIEIIIAGPAN